jgi:cobalt-precorrin-5B (C1)-methyltransferase
MKRKSLRYGFTTGACAAAAAKGAALMLRDRICLEGVDITLPCGETAMFRLHGQVIGENSASCFVVKDAGDDTDVTNGAEIHATVTLKNAVGADPCVCPGRTHGFAPTKPVKQLIIEGGIGVGRVTKPGLSVPVGEWAINPVPRKMIAEAVSKVFPPDFSPLTPHVTISIPNGEELAKKTLNARLGIIGGLSILGTTGIVRPISAQAWTDTIDAAIDVALACGCETLVLSTGRTSEITIQRFFFGRRGFYNDGRPRGLRRARLRPQGGEEHHPCRSVRQTAQDRLQP